MTLDDDNEGRWDADRERLRIARNLTAIEDAYGRLLTEAVHHPNADIPGGIAMVLLGPGADVEAWDYRQISAIMRDTPIEWPTRSEVEPPLAFLAGWADIIRAARSQPPTTHRATISHEIRYLRSALDWMLTTNDNNAPWWLPIEDFTTQLARVRATLDRAVGLDPQRDTGAPCLNENCGGRLLIKIWSLCERCERDTHTADDADDHADQWLCEKCRRWYTAAEYNLAQHAAVLAKAEWLTATDMLDAWRIKPADLRNWARTRDNRGRDIKPAVRRKRDTSGRWTFNVADAIRERDTRATQVLDDNAEAV